MTKKEIQEMQDLRLDFIENHPGMTLKEIAEIFGIDEKYAYKCINNFKKSNPSINVQGNENPNGWTQTEISFLSKNRGKSAKWLAANKPGRKRTEWAISKKMQSLGITYGEAPYRYSPEQEAFLRRYKNEPVEWIMENMPEPRKCARSIRQKFRQMKIPRKGPHGYYCKTAAEHPIKHDFRLNKKKGRISTIEEQLQFIKDHIDESGAWISKNMPEPKKSKSTINRIKQKLQKESPQQ